MDRQQNKSKATGRVVGPRLSRQRDGPGSNARLMGRRTFLRNAGMLAAAMAVVNAPGLLSDRWIQAAHAVTSDLVRDTLNGLLAFVVPGPDVYSLQQGASTTTPGGIDAGVIDDLIDTLDLSAPFAPQFSSTVAAILNDVGQQVRPTASGPFPSAFARLTFADKATVFAIMESIDPLKNLAGVLPALVAFLAYSEAGVFDPQSRTLKGRPVGWTLSNYEGVADGRNEFKGYFQNRRKVDGKREDDDA